MARAIDSHGVLTGSFLLDERELVEWGGLCGVLQAEPGRLLLSEGEPVECVYLIQDGEAELYCRRGRRRCSKSCGRAKTRTARQSTVKVLVGETARSMG